MAIRISTAAAIASCDALTALVDGGATAGELIIYSGTRPANADEAVTSQVALVNFTLPNPSFAGAIDANNGGHAVLNATDPVTADATGTASWFRIYDGDGDSILDGTVSDTEGSGDLKLSSTAIIEAIEVAIVSGTITLPKGA